MKVPGWGGGRLGRILFIILAIAILGALGAWGYVTANPEVGERFTEFYILGLSGKATDYPMEIRGGEAEKVIVGIVNHEREAVSYRIEVKIDGVKNNEVMGVELRHEEGWEREVSFTPAQLGDNQKVEFLLYRQGQSEAYRSLHLWVSVKE